MKPLSWLLACLMLAPLVSLQGAENGATKPGVGLLGRFVRLELPNRPSLVPDKRFMCFFEVEVYSAGRNVARQGKVTQVGRSGASAGLAVDGDMATFSDAEHVTDPWIEIDLGEACLIDKIKVLPRLYPFEGGVVTVLDGARNVVWYQRYCLTPDVLEVAPKAFPGRYVGLHVAPGLQDWYDVGGEQPGERTIDVTTVEVPSAPNAAQRMAVFNRRDSDEGVAELCTRFFAAIDPAAKGLEQFKSLYERGEYRKALDAYRDFFFARLGDPEPHGTPLRFFDGFRREILSNPSALMIDSVAVHEAMHNRRVKIRGKTLLVAGVGEPGAARWTPQEPVPGVPVREGAWGELPAPDVHLFTAEQTDGPDFRMFDDLLKSYAATGNTVHLQRWLDYLDDWCLNGRHDVFNSRFNLTRGAELITQSMAQRFGLLRLIWQKRPAVASDFRATTLARYLMATIEDLPPYLIRARRAELANWGCMGTGDMAYLSLLLPEFRAMQYFSREAIRLGMSSYLQHRSLDGDNIEAWDVGHRTADADIMELFELLPRLPVTTPKADTLQTLYLRDLTDVYFRNIFTDVAPGGFWRTYWLPDDGQTVFNTASDYEAARKYTSTYWLRFERWWNSALYDRLRATDSQANVRAAVILGEPHEAKPRRTSDILPYAGIFWLRDSWDDAAEALVLRNARSRSQDRETVLVGIEGVYGAGAMRYDLMKDGRGLLSAEGIVIDKKPSNAWHDAIPTGGKTMYCAMAERNVVPTRFHTSAGFDFAEAVRSDPYSRPEKVRGDWYGIWQRQPNIDNTPITGVTAYRQAFHVRGEGIWIVADRIANPAPHSFDYAQLWTVPVVLVRDSKRYRQQVELLREAGHRVIEEDALKQRIRTANPGFANTSTHFFGHEFQMVQGIDANGNYAETANSKDQLDIIYNAGDTKPQLAQSLRKTGIRWQGQGNQALVALHYAREAIMDPAHQFQNDLREIEEIKGSGGVTGFRAITATGTPLWFQSGPEAVNVLEAGAAQSRGESLLTVEKNGALSGMALGTDKTITLRGRKYQTRTSDFEYVLSEADEFIAVPIHRAIDTPQISPSHGIFTDSVQVSFSIPTQDTSDIDFRYTLDGSDPTLLSPLYTMPITITQDTYVKVRPFRKGLAETPFNVPSEEAGKTVGAIFRKEQPRPAATVARDRPGLSFKYYEGPWPILFANIGVPGQLEPTGHGTVTGLLKPEDVQAVRATDKAYAIKYDGYMRVPATGTYSFHAPQHLYTPTMDAGYDLRVWVDGEEWFPSPTLHSENVWSIALEAGPHRLEVTYVDYRWKEFKNEYWMIWQEREMWRGTPVLEVNGPGITKQPLPAAWLTHEIK